MDRPTFTDAAAADVIEEGQRSGGTLRLPEAGAAAGGSVAEREIVAVDRDLDGLAAFVQDQGARAVLSGDGRIALFLPSGKLFVIAGSEALVEAFKVAADIPGAERRGDFGLRDLLDGPPERLMAALASVAGTGERSELTTREITEHRPLSGEHAGLDEPGVLTVSGSSALERSEVGHPVGAEIAAMRALAAETRRWGRDDLKRGEAGSSGELVAAAVGKPLSHLVGLGDEEAGHRNGEKLSSSDNEQSEVAERALGQSLGHLGLLGDIDYLRASGGEDELDQHFEQGHDRPGYAPIDTIAAFDAIEDTTYTGRLFDPARVVLPVVDREVAMDPSFGSVALDADGSLVFTPAPGFSGIASFTYRFTDPRTGEHISGSVEVTVAAVADAPSVSGAAQTDEDTPAGVPVAIDLNDTDGSETIESVVISGVPVGATLDWDHGRAGVVQQGVDGTLTVSGTTGEITSLLQSLVLTPPKDFDGRITLDVAVTVVESNVPSTLPGYLDRETVHHAYHVDVEAVADAVSASGDSETTLEDVAVHLDDLAVTFGDTADGSEVHVVEIRGVHVDARIVDGTGAEYQVLIVGDGTRTYRLSPEQIGDVYFLPPPDESGTFSGMSVVAIATESSNGDREIQSAPIEVVVAPVADPLDVTVPAEATDEDTAVNIGGDIDIVVNDPLTQSVTSVTISGFPAGSIVGYAPVGGGAPVVVVAGVGGTLTFDGGSEAEIRAALATLTFTPPQNSDANITLSVSATTMDIGGVTDTRTVPMTIAVAAVADGPSVSSSASGDEDTAIALPVSVSLTDADGSESYEFAAITVPVGVTLIHVPVPPYGITVSVSGATTTFVPGVATTAAEFEAFLATGLAVQAPADGDANFDVAVRVGTIESALSGGEVSLLRAEQGIGVTVAVHPVVDMPVVTGASAVDEDAAVNFGAAIVISSDDASDGSEAITRIVLDGIPASAAVGYTAAGGATVTVETLAGVARYTIDAGTEPEIRATLASFTLRPELHSDADIAVSISITKVDQTIHEAESAATVTETHTHDIRVAAVADGPALSASASGDEDSAIALPVSVSLIDADGSESYEFVAITVPAGVTLIHAPALSYGITVSVSGATTTFTPGPATAAVELEAFLATGLEVQAPADSDGNFDVTIRVGTIESVLSGGEVSLLRAEQSIVVPVAVHPVIDVPAVTGSSTVNEDGIVDVSDQAVVAPVRFGENIVISAPDSSDGSEAITAIEIGGFPVGAVMSFVPVGGGMPVSYTIAAGTTSLVLTGGSEAEIRAALASISLVPPAHSDADITLTLEITKSDATASESEGAATATFHATHTISVAAVADVPSGSGAATGLEDRDIPLSISVGHADVSDGSETIRDVVIAGVPAGLSLTETSTRGGALTLNTDGSYTVTGPNDAAIADVLTNLFLVIAPSGARLHADSDFALVVTVTTIESATGTAQNALAAASTTFSVPVTINAVADGVVHSGSSTLVEDVARTIGQDIIYSRIDDDGSETVTGVTVSGFPEGATVSWTDVAGTPHSEMAGSGGLTVWLSGGSASAIRAALDTLRMAAPAHVDDNIALTVSVTTLDNDGASITDTWTHAVLVQAVADAPAVVAGAIVLDEDTSASLMIDPARSADGDGSETLSVRITVPADGSGAIGTLSGNPPSGVTMTNLGGGVYLVAATGATPADRETALDGFLSGGIVFTPRTNWSGVLIGSSGIKVEAISTEAANAAELAPNNDASAGTGGDADTKTEIATTYIDVTVNAAVDLPVSANASTTVAENNSSTSASDPDLVVALGSRIGLSLADTDGSQGLALTLGGLPTNAQALIFAASRPGVTATTDIAAGTVTVSGANSSDVIAVLNSLSVTLADDDDRNFTVTIAGTATDSNGHGLVTAGFVLTHDVIVRAVADVPGINRGAATKPAVDEDSGFVAYPVTVTLNDGDGSESLQSVRIDYSTPGAGADPVLRFTAADGAIFDTTTPGTFTVEGMTVLVEAMSGASGRITISGGSSASIAAALASLAVRPGGDNGEDITVSIRATSVESNPSEDNNGAAAGMGGGVTGVEIAVATAVTTMSFVVPVTPLAEPLTLTLPDAAGGAEDTTFALGAITVASTNDADGSETRSVEIDTSSYPVGTTFVSGGVAVGTIVTTGWLRIPEPQSATLEIRPPVNFSGTIDLIVRGVVNDASSSGNVTTTTTSQILSVTVAPVADPVTTPTSSVGVEDEGVIALGASLVAALAPTDDGTGTGNNATGETISAISLRVPADAVASTYTVTPGIAVGSAEISFDADTRTYTITSTILTSALDVTAVTSSARAQAQSDIRATLSGLTLTMGPAHSDANGVVAVTVTALDVNGAVASTRDTSFDHVVRIEAVADAPGLVVTDPLTAVTEDGATIALNVVVANSADTDGSETLAVRITVPSDTLGPVGSVVGVPPSGVTITVQGGGVYVIAASGPDSATREALLNSFLAGGGIAFDPRVNWSGTLTGSSGIKVEAISTEAATGSELADASHGGADGTSKTETVTDYIDVRVTPLPDAPSVKGNGVGSEDALIRVPVTVTLGDRDGSESFVMLVTGVIPSGTKLYGAGGAEIVPDGSGVFHLSAADVSALTVLPPENYSSALGGDIVLTTETIVTESAGGVASFVQDILVAVTGVADTPGVRTVSVIADEDQPIGLGAAILASAGGNIDSLLVDRDGSETLYFVVGGLPAGVIPTSSVPGGVTYMGGGAWSISAAAMTSLVLPAVPNFSGVNPYAAVTVRVVTQEIDGDEASSPQWPVTIAVNPVIAGGTVDGLASWSMGATQTEAASEAGQSISFASIANHTYADDDGSERVVSYTVDLSSLLSDAGVADRLALLAGPGAGLDELVAAYVSGTYAYDSAAGTITIAAADIAGVALAAELFTDSNADFSLPVTALVRDTADLGGTLVHVDKIESGTFSVDLVGTADVPTVFATSIAGIAGARLPILLGGVSTDNDVALGRAASEDVYYVVSLQNPGTAPRLGFTDASGQVVGLDNGDGTWVLRPSDLVGLHVLTAPGASGIATLSLTTIAVENDGDRASNATTFTVGVTALPGVAGEPPLAPLVSVGASIGNEDGSITLVVAAVPAPGDTTNPSVAVMISDLPAGAEVVGARYNPLTGRYVASAAAINAGEVRIIPPADFSGSLDVTIEAVATNAALSHATTGRISAVVAVDPVADGVTIAASPAMGFEDQAVALGISLGLRDGDGSEAIGANVYVRLSGGATLVGGYAVVAAGDGDAIVEGTPVVGYYRIPAVEVGSLEMLPAGDWHGVVTADVIATSCELHDDDDGDNIAVTHASFAVTVEGVADAPIVMVPVAVTGEEDQAIAITGLTAALGDVVTANGAEVLSVLVSGVPHGSRFSAGANNGDGSWTIPTAALASLSITPPANFAGTMTLTMTAIALELVNGDEAHTSASFDVIATPHADEVLLNADNVAIGESASAPLALNVRMADGTGTLAGETAPETIEITFSGVPDGVTLLASGGGLITSTGTHTWVFSGSEAEANAITLAVDEQATSGTHVVAISAVTVDGSDVLAIPVTDSFRIVIPAMVVGTSVDDALDGSAGTELMFGVGGDDTLHGGGGADHLDGGGGADILDGGEGDDWIRGGAGGDTMTGGGGRDTFVYAVGDDGGTADTITDFTAGPGGDAIDIESLLVGYDPGTSDISAFVSISEAAGDTTVSIDVDGGGDSFAALAVLVGVTGLDVGTMQANANLIV